MNGFPTNGDGETGGFCPEAPLDEPQVRGYWHRHDGLSPRHLFRAAWPGWMFCVCGTHRRYHPNEKP